MNITQETNDYFSTTEIERKLKKGIHPKDPLRFPSSSSPLYSLSDVIITDLKDGDFIDRDINDVYRNFHNPQLYLEPPHLNTFKAELTNWKEIENNMDLEYCNTDSGLKDKLKTTPDRGIKKIGKVFRVDWSKVFKRGWLLWK